MKIAIDGPAGAGKSTVAKLLAKEMGFVYVDTGAMYRAMALFFLRKGIAAKEEAAICAACEAAEISICYREGMQQVILNGENVSEEIRNEAVGNMASATSVYPAVRKKLVRLQQQLAAGTDVVMDGRDIGTCVLVDAQVKIFLTASAAVRAKRRYDELSEKGIRCDLAAIQKDIEERDERDMNREESPLRQADDAVFFDSSDKTVKEAVDFIKAICRERQ